MAFQWLFLISIAAGFVGAMSGMGGGVVLIPAMTLAGMDIKQAIPISIVSVIATSCGSAAAYVRDRITNLKVGMFLEMFTIVGALVGAKIALASGQSVLFILFGLVLLSSWGALFLERRRQWQPAEHQDRFSQWLELEGSYYDRAGGQTVRYRAVRAYFGGPLMFIAGLIAGMLGIGAGALKVLIHDLVMGLPPKVSTTTSNLIIGVTALAGSSVYLAAGAVDPGLVAPVVLGILLGAYIGTKVLVRLTNQAVRWFFMVVLLVLGIEMLARGIAKRPMNQTDPPNTKARSDAQQATMDALIGYVLLGGVMLSVALIIAGLVWHWIKFRQLGIEYAIPKKNLFEFLVAEVGDLLRGNVRPRLLVSLGFAALLLTPYLRVLASFLFFAFVQRNWKYAPFTFFVLAVLTYSLFLR